MKKLYIVLLLSTLMLACFGCGKKDENESIKNESIKNESTVGFEIVNENAK
ncbi:hypothetical protein SAMN02745245_01921 [Anaerosphaera aminiphila DSM 21120]|uniref:Uncharacterized protein n=1 Tax=Anaerosphaera aminiphila DSM 21120 TaxID=1120995 RepID=A0A1M5UYL2_9FIRM|nr:hypothetical protein [Anaerosphaera aminiphila]SHH68010.1 hypothetical protein SAMN02745245_01921 [Anaerosphaera aminiphila DSM 21120]